MEIEETVILEKPFEEITPRELQEFITKKFGALSRFAHQNGIEVQNIFSVFRNNKSLRGKEKLKEIYEKAKKQEPGIVFYDLTPEKKRELKAAIYMNYESITDFCQKNPEFTPIHISHIFNKSTKEITKKVRKLGEILNVAL